MKHYKVAKEVFVSPAKLVLTFAAFILVTDYLLELLQLALSPLHTLTTAFLESIVFVVVLTPVLYLLLFRPMARYINALKKAEDEIRKEKAFSESLIRIANVLVLGLDTKGNITLFSNAAEALTGYTFEELKGRNWFETVVPKSEYPQVWEAFSKISQGGEMPKYFENPVLTKSGAERIISWQNGSVIEEGKVTGLIAFGIDVTDRKRAELEMQIHMEIDQGFMQTEDVYELLKLVHQALKKILYAENCFFALYDQQTGLFNFPYFVDQFDSAPQPQSLGKSCTAYVFRTGNSLVITPEKFRQLTEQNEIELIGSSSPSWLGVPLRTLTGKIGVLVLQHYEKENIYNEKDRIFLESIANHVTSVIERRKGEEELEKSNSLLSATLESTADGILVVDKEGKVAGFNSKFVELWQIPDSIAATRDDKTLLTFVLDQLSDPEGFINKVNELYQNNEETCLDFVMFKDGRTFERYTQAQTIKGKSVGRVWSFRDVTDRMKFIDELRIKEANLRELNATKDKFFSIIAHDLKSPFNTILGFGDILVDQSSRKDYEGIEDYARIIRDSSQKAVDLLANLIEWSRSQSGRMDFNPEDVELGSLINEVFDLCNGTAAQKSILLAKDLPHHLFAYLDKSMISGVLRNLITNAVKFTHPGGSIVVRAEQMGQEVKISIIDNGIGIESSNLNKLFKIDENYSIPGTQNEKGTGLGLLLCKEFVDKHGGRIWAESEPGKGSRFNFTIPNKQQTMVAH